MLTRLRATLVAALGLGLFIASTQTVAAATWQAQQTLTSSKVAAAHRAALVSPGTNKAVIAYADKVGGVFRVVIRRSTDGGATWKAPVAISPSGVYGISIPTAVARGGTVIVAWTEYTNNGTRARLKIRRSTNSGRTWLAPQYLTSGQNNQWPGFPGLAMDGSGRVAVVWSDEQNGNISGRVSTDHGANFGMTFGWVGTTNKPYTGSLADLYEAFPAVTITGGKINLVYYESATKLVHRRSGTNGTSWSASTTITNRGDGAYPAIASAGTKVIVGYGVMPISTDFFTAYKVSTNRGRTFGSQRTLSGRAKPPSLAPSLSYAGGTWRAAFERCLDQACSTSAVFVRTSGNGTAWSSPLRASTSATTYATPSGVAAPSGKTLATFIGYDWNGTGWDTHLFSRLAS